MSIFNVLIVDDQRDVRRVLSAGLQTLGQQMDVVEVPSAEEALLIAPRRNYDLIVTDVRLPGISGLELVKRVKLRNPKVKIILMTGAEDRQTRRQVEDAGVFAFFYKPIEMADFLDSVERALGLVETVFSPPPLDLKLTIDEPAEPAAAAKREAAPGIASEQSPQALPLLAPLSTLAAQNGLLCAALLNSSGTLLSQAGNFSNLQTDPALLAALLAAGQVNHQLSIILTRPIPSYFLFLEGSNLSVGLAPVGKDHFLLIAGEKPFQNTMDHIGSAMQRAARDLVPHIFDQRYPSQPATDPGKEAVQEKEAAPSTKKLLEGSADEDLLASLAHVEISEDDMAAIDDLFGGVGSALKTDSLDAFWDSAIEETESVNLNESHISYDEARDLGLTPE